MDRLLDGRLSECVIPERYRHSFSKFDQPLTACRSHAGKCVDNDACSNWNRRFECPPNCKGGRRGCGNRRIAKGLPKPPTKIVNSKSKGYKLYSTAVIPKDTLLMEYTGCIKKRSDYDADCKAAPGRKTFALVLVKGFVIDATLMGNESRFANHDCRPNLKVEQWHTDDGSPRMMLVSAKKIWGNEELCWDYGLRFHDKNYEFDCKCGRVSCRYKSAVKDVPRRTVPNLECGVCGRVFTRKSSLNRHSKLHKNTPELDFDCQVCDKRFGRRDARDKHLKTHLDVRRDFHCTKCPSTFIEKHHLKKHKEAMHSKDRELIVCGEIDEDNRECGKKLHSLTGMALHRLKKHPPRAPSP